MSWLDYLVPLGTAGGGAASVYGLVVRPRQKEHEKHEIERAEQRRVSDGFMYGIKPIPGVTDGVLAAPLRLQGVEEGLKENTEAVKAMGQWQKEANGTYRRIEGMVNDLTDMVKDIKGAPPGATLPQVVDAVHAHDEKTETKQAEILSAIEGKPTA
jgi:hypothetical protein